MKYLFFTICSLSPFILLGQNKKEQIKDLNLQIDSLIQVQQITREKYDISLNEIELKINQQDHRIKSIQDSIFNQKKEINKYRNLISEYESKIKQLTDSIQIIQLGEGINILDKSVIKLTESQIISIMNIDLSSIIIDGYTIFNEIEKPKINLAHIQPYKIGNAIFAFTIVNIVNPKGCNGCSGTNIIGCLELKDKRWVRKNILNTNSSPRNSWGEAAEYVNFYLAGKSSIAIELIGGQTGTGVSTRIRNIYLINKSGQIIKAYDNLSHEDDLGRGGKTNDDWNIKFIESEKEIFDIEEIKSSNNKIIKTRLLKFDKYFNIYQ